MLLLHNLYFWRLCSIVLIGANLSNQTNTIWAPLSFSPPLSKILYLTQKSKCLSRGLPVARGGCCWPKWWGEIFLHKFWTFEVLEDEQWRCIWNKILKLFDAGTYRLQNSYVYYKFYLPEVLKSGLTSKKENPKTSMVVYYLSSNMAFCINHLQILNKYLVFY